MAKSNSGRVPLSASGVCGVAALLLCVTACAPDPQLVRLDVYDWWDQDAEKVAFDSVLQRYKRKWSNTDVVTTTDDRAPYTRDRLARRMLAGAPPATFQANSGADLLRWTMVDTDSSRPSKCSIQGLTELFQRTGLTGTVPEPLLKALQVGGSDTPYAVPIDIHRLNVLYINHAAGQRYADKHPDKSLLDLSTLCPDDPNAAPLLAPLALGAQQRFTLVLLALENLLPALAGADFYEAFLRGEEPSSVAGVGDWRVDVRRALRCTQYLAKSATNLGEGWTDAVEEVRSGAATFTVMGDWAGGQFAADLALGKVDAHPFPNTDTLFVFTSDTFPLPIGTEHPVEAEQLLETLASPDAQKIFSEFKGSIPARNDVVVEGQLGKLAAQTQRDFARTRQLGASSAYFPPYYPQDELGERLFDMISSRAGDDEIEAVVNLLRDAMPALAAWQARLKQGASEPGLP